MIVFVYCVHSQSFYTLCVLYNTVTITVLNYCLQIIIIIEPYVAVDWTLPVTDNSSVYMYALGFYCFI